MEKTTVFNLIILDESGSMISCQKATIDGCNEVINVARSSQKKHPDTQNSFISIYAFQDGEVPSRYLRKNEKPENMKAITAREYQPWGMTPLFDAVGMTLAELMAIASTHDDATGIVTIITDGCENCSKEYDLQKVRHMIRDLKEQGWQFNFIGANIDVDKVADSLAIDSRMAFSSDEKGTEDMFHNFGDCLSRHNEMRVCEEANLSKEERVKLRRSKSHDFFK